VRATLLDDITRRDATAAEALLALIRAVALPRFIS